MPKIKVILPRTMGSYVRKYILTNKEFLEKVKSKQVRIFADYSDNNSLIPDMTGCIGVITDFESTKNSLYAIYEPLPVHNSVYFNIPDICIFPKGVCDYKTKEIYIIGFKMSLE